MLERRFLDLEHISLSAGYMRQAVEDIVECDPEDEKKNLLALYVGRRLNEALKEMETIGCMVNECDPSAFWEDPKFYPIPVSPAEGSEHTVFPLESDFLTQTEARQLKESLAGLDKYLSENTAEGSYAGLCDSFADSTKKLVNLLDCFWVPVWDGSDRHIRVSMAADGDVHVAEMVVDHE